jgi:hypothetical protein
MQTPEYISERGSSWRDIAAMWLVAAFVLGLVGLSGSLFGYRSQHVAEAGLPVMTAVAEVHDGFKQHGDDQVYRVSAQVAATVNAG